MPPFSSAARQRIKAIPIAEADRPDYKPSWEVLPTIGEESNTSINQMVSSFSGGGYAQPNRYIVEIFPPKKHPNLSSWKADIFLRCESIILPGRNLSTTPDSNIHGPLRTVVNNANFADSINMVFQVSNDLRERVLFEKWQELAFNKVSWNVGYYNDYIGSVEIYLLDKKNIKKYGLKLHECFPVTIGPTELSYASKSEIVTIPISMNFRYWTSVNDGSNVFPRSQASFQYTEWSHSVYDI